MRLLIATFLCFSLSLIGQTIPIQVDRATSVLASPLNTWTANASGISTALGLGTAATHADTDFQFYDAELAAFAGLTSAADALPYFTGTATMATTPLSAFMRTVLDDVDAATVRATLGVGTGSGSVTDVSVVSANGVSGSVANSTTTPAITLTLGAITPSSVNGVVLSGSATPTLAVTGTTTVSGSNTGDQTTISGNAGTATALQTGRTINGTTFDGTANITIASDAGTLTGSTLASGVTASSLLSAAGGSFGTAAFTASTAYQAADAELAALAGLTSAADKLPYFTGSGTASLADLSSAARTVIDDASVSAMVDTLGGASSTGSGGLVRSTSPSLTTPSLGVATATSINKLTITSPATGSTMTVDDGKTLRSTATLTLSGTDSTVMTFPNSSATIAGLGIAQTFSAANTFSANGAASTPGLYVSGTPFTGGSASTTTPQLLIGSGTAGGYSGNGTMLGINAPNLFTGNLLFANVNGGSSVFSVSYTGALTTAQSIVCGNNLQIASISSLSWSSSRGIITSPSAGAIQLGAADAAAPVAQTLSVQSVVTGQTDTAGVDWTWNGSRGTGTNKSGSFVKKTGNTTTTGSTQHALSTRESVAGKYTELTEASATTIFTVTVGTGNYIGMVIEATVWATDGTDQQVLNSIIQVNTANKSGTIGTTGISQADCGTPYNTSGTLTPVTYTLVDNGSGVLAVKCNATSSLSQTSLRCKWQARINSNDAATVTPN